MGVTKSHSFFLFLRFLINRGACMFSKNQIIEKKNELNFVAEV